MTLDKITANFDAIDERPAGSRNNFIGSGTILPVLVNQIVRLALLEGGERIVSFADVTVIPDLMQFTRFGPALGWTLRLGETIIHTDSMSITCDDHIDGKATLYLTREGKMEVPVIRLVGFDEQTGEHQIELSTCVEPVALSQERLMTAA